MADPRTRLVAPLRRNLRQLLFRVHPDYFHRWPAQKRANELALQRLYALLAPALTPDTARNREAARGHTHTNTSVEFYVRATGGAATASAQVHIVGQAFSAPLSAHKRTLAESCALAESLFALCEKAGVPPTVEETQLLNTLRQTAARQTAAEEAAMRSKSRSASAAASIREQFLSGLRTSFAADTASHGAIRSRVAASSTSSARKAASAAQMEHALQLYAARGITTAQAASARSRLIHCITQVPTGWWQLPVMVGLAYGRHPPGFLCVPYDLQPTGK
ncbi:hypothetical protein THASP1DRAFT_30419 [Thamnocephalis sphaerospora]|uniref:DUF4460 domain-containing protein n=1 Tax=Thamnocephalis sphaerospora TaxID=78915 RepID=A0A4P9XP35_9FUNG|nr:hypothetical protein THASP1DRAFT_30419 [Thamnocephalis sphaerospora]|eukprot:RKP07764.1 hypothetical protein THASP1DRAFT_30419 [Thamnocephalis sphaerospora]